MDDELKNSAITKAFMTLDTSYVEGNTLVVDSEDRFYDNELHTIYDCIVYFRDACKLLLDCDLQYTLYHDPIVDQTHIKLTLIPCSVTKTKKLIEGDMHQQ